MAAASTKRYAEGNPLSVMDGIPVAVKEEFHVVRYNIVNGITKNIAAKTNSVFRHLSESKTMNCGDGFGQGDKRT